MALAVGETTKLKSYFKSAKKLAVILAQLLNFFTVWER